MKYITQAGLEKLKKELEHRKVKTRREIAESIKEAKEQGDLSENAEYAEAKRQQRENEARIMLLENIIRTSSVVFHSGSNGTVEIGSVVDIETNGKKMTCEIVGSNEADPLGGKISNESIIGKSFLRKKKDEKFMVALPNGKKVKYQILEIR